MAANGTAPETDPALPELRRRPRPARMASLGLILFMTVSVGVIGRGGLGAPPEAATVRSVDGPVSRTEVVETTRPQPADQVMRSLRRLDPTTSTTTTTAAPTTTTAAPTTTTAVPTTTVPPTTAPPATTTPPTTAPPTTTAPPPAASHSQSGQATWYRWKAGNCAHNSLPMGTRVTVTNRANGASAVCVVGDRGAFGPPTIIDLDASVFEQIAPLGAGRIDVTITW